MRPLLATGSTWWFECGMKCDRNWESDYSVVGRDQPGSIKKTSMRGVHRIGHTQKEKELDVKERARRVMYGLYGV